MSGELSTYTFLPWLRQGIANNIQTADGDASVKVRASIAVDLDLKGSGGGAGDITRTVSKNVALYGPGDIIGIESRAIIKTEPYNWITNFEPNYLPYIDFYDEDFPWRYTPAAPDGGRLRPWVALVILEEGEFQEGGNIQGKPLPFIEVEDFANVLPPASELWAWAHVHVNKNIIAEQEDPHAGDMAGVLAQFTSLLDQDADMAYSRIVCPRKLDPSSRYHGFLVPTFETGRLAGLGLDPANAPHATASAWETYDGREAPAQFPFYHRWFFRTGTRGDFEYLVRLLTPKPADARVGRRDIDVQDPGSNISGITDPQLEGVLKLGGALLAPLSDAAEAELQKWELWDQPYPHSFQIDLAEFINLADSYASQDAAGANQNTGLDDAIKNDPDPLITPPIYGRWHAFTNRLLTEKDGSDVPNNANWVHNLNLDPRWRSAAGFGTDVVRDNQEEYMDAAWDQIGDVLEANRRIRQAQLAKQVSWYWYDRQLKPLQKLSNDKVLVFTAPMQKRVLSEGLTVFHQVKQSPITTAVTSAPLRRMLRPRARLERYSAFDANVNLTNLVSRVNSGVVTAAPPHTVPPDLPTLDNVAADLLPKGYPNWLLTLLRNFPWFKNLPLILAVIMLVLLLFLLLIEVSFGVLAAGFAIAAGLFYLWRLFNRLGDQIGEADSILEENQTPAAVDDMPPSPDFTITAPVDLAALDPANPPGAITLGGNDSAQSARFKNALKDLYQTLQVSMDAGKAPELKPINVAQAAAATIQSLNPLTTVPRYTLASVMIPAHILGQIGEKFVEAMAYPEFDIPMYKPLVDRSTELFVPNLNFVEQNSITLLKTNQKFIESYMVGLNHEFARELLWREYPTDQRGSYFRQFWDVSSFLSSTEDDAQRREELKDIPPLHLWSRFSRLGDHDNREQGLENEEELVLVIRGELLKKYPNAVIYANKAKWQPKSDTDPAIDKTKERVFDTTVPIKTPLYEAKVSPDIYFFGFDLTEEEAKGDDTVDDKPGWFFVIKERPGEPRFGLDIDRPAGDKIWVWNDLAWEDVVPGVTSGAFIKLAQTPTVPLQGGALPTAENEKEEQRKEDLHIPSWHGGLNAAEIAYILYQAPVLMGVHASEMLPE